MDAPAVRLDGDLPPEQRFRQLPAGVLDRGRELIDDLRQHLPKGAGGLALAVNARTKGRWRSEAEALADLLGTSWAEVLVANCSYDLALSGFACSAAALATPDGPVLARNMDWSPAGPLARASLLTETRYAEGPGGGPLTVWNAGWPGGIGVVTGQSSRGFALSLNAVGVAGAPDLLGCPVLLCLRRVLTVARDFADAVVRIRRERLVCGAIVTVVGRTNAERVVVERTPRRSGVLWGEGEEPLVATNHLRVLDAAGGAGADDAGGRDPRQLPRPARRPVRRGPAGGGQRRRVLLRPDGAGRPADVHRATHHLPADGRHRPPRRAAGSAGRRPAGLRRKAASWGKPRRP